MHPDKEGGSEEAFQRISEAQQVLADADKRKGFDLGDDFKRERMNDGSEGPSFQTEQHKKYFPEEFEFEPFIPDWEHRDEVLEEQRKRMEALRSPEKSEELPGNEEDHEHDDDHEDDDGDDHDDDDQEHQEHEEHDQEYNDEHDHDHDEV